LKAPFKVLAVAISIKVSLHSRKSQQSNLILTVRRETPFEECLGIITLNVRSPSTRDPTMSESILGSTLNPFGKFGSIIKVFDSSGHFEIFSWKMKIKEKMQITKKYKLTFQSKNFS
jgi:hypothetical protein